MDWRVKQHLFTPPPLQPLCPTENMLCRGWGILCNSMRSGTGGYRRKWDSMKILPSLFSPGRSILSRTPPGDAATSAHKLWIQTLLLTYCVNSFYAHQTQRSIEIPQANSILWIGINIQLRCQYHFHVNAIIKT